MKTFVSRVAGMSVGLMVAGSAVMAGEFNPQEISGAECYALVSGYTGGISSISATKEMAADKHVLSVAAEFRQIMSASDQAHACYQKMMSGKDGVELIELRAGADSAGKVFAGAQEQFAGWIDEMSQVLLADVAPAAGGGAQADLAAEAKMESGMELLIDSYMLLENADELNAKISGLTKRGN